MRILISGSCGFIFSNFVLYSLIKKPDWDIVGIDKLTYAGQYSTIPQGKRYKIHVADICDYHSVKKIFEIEKPDIVIHAAAESHIDNSIRNSNECIKTNVVGTHSMLEAALKGHIPTKFINVSTYECYGSIEDAHSKETDPLEPRSPYSSSKAAADLLGKSYYTTYGLPVITTRCCNNFGPRQHVEKFIPKIITSVYSNQKIPIYGDGKNIREWLYVQDHFDALRLIIENGVVGETYNISSGYEKQNVEVLHDVFELMGHGEELVEYVCDRPGHDKRYASDTSKIRSLGWEPKFEFKESLHHTIGWYGANRWAWKK